MLYKRTITVTKVTIYVYMWQSSTVILLRFWSGLMNQEYKMLEGTILALYIIWKRFSEQAPGWNEKKMGTYRKASWMA